MCGGDGSVNIDPCDIRANGIFPSGYVRHHLMPFFPSSQNDPLNIMTHSARLCVHPSSLLFVMLFVKASPRVLQWDACPQFVVILIAF